LKKSGNLNEKQKSHFHAYKTLKESDKKLFYWKEEIAKNKIIIAHNSLLRFILLKTLGMSMQSCRNA